MPFLNHLEESHFRASERLSAWILSLLGYFTAMGMLVNPAGWKTDPVYHVVAQVPWTPYSWAVVLLAFTAVFNLGYVTQTPWRGTLIITGALLCAIWWMALALCMSRMVYEKPETITGTWPLVAVFISVLYLSRVVVYSNMFTGDRWATNPYQTWDTTFLMFASLSQVIVGISPISVLSEIERPAALTVGGANLFGALVVMYGLHLKDKEQGLNYELAGAFSLVLTLGWYCTSVLSREPLAGSTLGFSMPEAFVFATFHRGIQVLTLKWSRWSGRDILERRMIRALNPTELPPYETPPPPEVHEHVDEP